MRNKGFIVEDKWIPEALQFLESKGFKDVKRMPRYSLYDFTAKKNGEECFIEMKTRSPDAETQIFHIKPKKLSRLKELKEVLGKPVYLLFINKHGKWLMELDEFLELHRNSKYPMLRLPNGLKVIVGGRKLKRYLESVGEVIRREYGIKPKTGKEAITIMLEEDLKNRLDKIIREKFYGRISRSALIEMLIREALSREERFDVAVSVE